MSDTDMLLLGPAVDGAEFVRLTGISAIGHHGVYPDERRHGQRFVVDVTLRLARTSGADEIGTTVHYGELAEAVAGEIAGEIVNLIETLAARIADRCLVLPLVTGVVVTVHKPEAPMDAVVADAAVTVVRLRP